MSGSYRTVRKNRGMYCCLCHLPGMVDLSPVPPFCRLVAAMAGTSGCIGGCDAVAYRADGYRPFSNYYQLGRGAESGEAENEPLKERESKGRMEGSHSPFGFIWQIAAATGWSVHYILWKVPYPTLLLMLSDAPHWVEGGQKKKLRGIPGKNARNAPDTAAKFAAINQPMQ